MQAKQAPNTPSANESTVKRQEKEEENKEKKGKKLRIRNKNVSESMTLRCLLLPSAFESLFRFAFINIMSKFNIRTDSLYSLEKKKIC